MIIIKRAHAQRISLGNQPMTESDLRHHGWLAKDTIHPGRAGLIIGPEAQDGALSLALDVSSTNLGDAPRELSSKPGVANGHAVVFCAASENNVRRRVQCLDPTGERCKASAGRNGILAYGDNSEGGLKLFTRDSNGRVAETPMGAKIKRILCSGQELALIAFSPLTAFLPANWATPECVYFASRWFNCLAMDTGAAVLGAISDDEYSLLQAGVR